MTWLAALALPLALLAVGWRPAGRLARPARNPSRRPAELPERAPGYRATLAFLLGAQAFYLALLLLDALGVPWSRATLVTALLFLALLFAGLTRALPAREPAAPAGFPALAPGWGDLIALLSLLAFTLLAATQWIVLPDFIYHWGYKAEHFALARGLDPAWLARSWNATLHPDYPNLLPALYAATSILAGKFAAAPLMLWSAVFFLGILASARDVLGRCRVDRFMLQGTVVLLGLLLTALGAGYRLAGGADWMLALALLAAAPPLLAGSRTWRADLQIGIAAAFAAAAKIEGIPLAAFLVLVHAARHLRLGARPFLRSLALSAALPAAVVLPWWIEVRRFNLFQASNTAPFDAERIRPVAAALFEALAAPELHGLPWLVLLLPVLLLARRTRPLGAVCAAQLLFYLWAYLASDLEPRFYVLSNFARLLFHLLPAILVGAVIATQPGTESAPDRPAPGDG